MRNDKMNKAQLVNTVVGRLLKQGAYAADARIGNCQYLTKSGAQCAVGILFSKDEADKMQENGNASIEDLVELAVMPIWVNRNVRLLSALQRIHDRGAIHAKDFVQMALEMSELPV